MEKVRWMINLEKKTSRTRPDLQHPRRADKRMPSRHLRGRFCHSDPSPARPGNSGKAAKAYKDNILRLTKMVAMTRPTFPAFPSMPRAHPAARGHGADPGLGQPD